jgi:hypothetical protein
MYALYGLTIEKNYLKEESRLWCARYISETTEPIWLFYSFLRHLFEFKILYSLSHKFIVVEIQLYKN